MAEFSQITPPLGVLPGQLGVILIGRVIMGDIAATVVDLALRQHIRVEEAPNEGWLISRSGNSNSQTLAAYEKTLLDVLPDAPALLSGIENSVPEETRKALVHDGVARGWLRHLLHERTAVAEELATHVLAFRRQMRQALRDHNPDALADSLLPYALHFGLAADDGAPLARFSQAWVDTFAHLPGWRPAAPARRAEDVTITINSDHDLANAAAMDWVLGAL